MTSRMECFRRDAAVLLRFMVIINVLLCAVLLLENLGVTSSFEILEEQLSLRNESGLATWYSSALFLTCAALALCLARGYGRFNWSGRHFGWWIVFVIMLALSADEICQLHEWIGVQVTARIGTPTLGWDDHYDAPGGSAWVLALLPFIIVAASVLVHTIWTSLKAFPAARWIALLGLICWIIVIPLEMMEGRLWRLGIRQPIHTTFEEALEVIGASLFIWSFARALWLDEPVLDAAAAASTANTTESSFALTPKSMSTR